MKVCSTTNPNGYSSPFLDNGWPRLILYPYSYEPEEDFKRLFIEMAKIKGNNFVYVKLLAHEDAKDYDYRSYWQLDLEDIGNIISAIAPDENVLYPPSGDWAVVATTEQHALFTFHEEYSSLVEMIVPNPDILAKHFLLYWDELKTRLGYSVKWIPPTLQHILGKEKATKLLLSAGFSLDIK